MFSREYEIVRLLAHDAKRLWPDMVGELVLRAERGYGRGVADLVVLDIDHANLLERRNCGLPPARRAGEAVVLEAVIAKAGEPLETILSAIPMTRSHARRLMSQLADVGLVQVEDGAAFPAWPGAPIAARVVAIEAKLANWRGGAIQADRYLAFADEAYLAMPTERIETLLRHPDRLDGLDLGLIAVSDGECSIAVPAPVVRPRIPAVRRWLDEAEYGELIGSSRQLIRPFPARFEQPTPAALLAVS